jgi:hypothetical protein
MAAVLYLSTSSLLLGMSGTFRTKFRRGKLFEIHHAHAPQLPPAALSLVSVVLGYVSFMKRRPWFLIWLVVFIVTVRMQPTLVE